MTFATPLFSEHTTSPSEHYQLLERINALNLTLLEAISTSDESSTQARKALSDRIEGDLTLIRDSIGLVNNSVTTLDGKLDTKVSELNAAISAMSTNLTTLVNTTKSELEETDAELLQAISALDGEIAQKLTELESSLISKIGVVNNRLTAVAESIRNEMSTGNNGLDSKVEANNQAIVALDGVLNSLQSTFNARVNSVDTSLGNIIETHRVDKLSLEELNRLTNVTITNLTKVVGDESTKLSELKTAFDLLMTRTDNPFSVTAGQTGAYTKAQVNSTITTLTNTLRQEIKDLSDSNDTDHGLISTRIDLLSNSINTLSNEHAASVVAINKSISDQDKAHKLITNSLDGRIDGTVTRLNHVESSINAHGASITEIDGRLTAHIANRNNPNKVTAAQVNSYTKTESNSRYAATSHSHPWDNLSSIPVYAKRWPTLEEIGLSNVKNIDSTNANNINKGLVKNKQIPVAPKGTTAGVGFGGFRYNIVGTKLFLYTT